MTNGDRTDGRLDRWTARRSARLRGYNLWEIFVDAVRTGAEHRLTGLAAEMAFFTSLALIPFTAAFGAVLGYSSRWWSSRCRSCCWCPARCSVAPASLQRCSTCPPRSRCCGPSSDGHSSGWC